MNSYDALPGEWFTHYVQRIQSKIKGENGFVIGKFNDITLTINKKSLIDDISLIYDLKRELSWLKDDLK